jgi:type IV pilus assembly protein PilV
MAPQRGALLIEVLVSIVLCAFALLGFAAMQSRATTAEFEALQRSQALILVEDMASRLSANRAAAGSYVSAGLIGAGAVVDCSGLASAALDLCEWANLLRGSSETRAGNRIGSMLSARGCITRAAGVSDRYLISVAWQGIAATGAPAAACGRGSGAFPDETLRRAVSSTVCVALLRDAATPAATPRC